MKNHKTQSLKSTKNCSQLRSTLLHELCALSREQLNEIGTWHGNVTATVEYLLFDKNCRTESSASS